MKIRADQLAVQQGLCPSRAQARQLIEDGALRLSEAVPLRKAGQLVEEGTPLCLLRRPQYVSRGAYKLLAALKATHPEVAGRTALDLGASTGGFTDVLLQHGAKCVYAVDVGYGQLHDKLRRDPRVVVLEHTHAKSLTRELVPVPIDILVADVSFISLIKVLPFCAPLLAPEAWIALLVKPQFEAGREAIASGGIVRDEETRRKCLSQVRSFAEREFGWRCLAELPSPIEGGDGNQEYLLVLSHGALPREEKA